jgi:hypothetical protein
MVDLGIANDVQGARIVMCFAVFILCRVNDDARAIAGKPHSAA